MLDLVHEPAQLRRVGALDDLADAAQAEGAQRVALALVRAVGRLDLLDRERAHAGVSSASGAAGSSADGASAAGASSAGASAAGASSAGASAAGASSARASAAGASSAGASAAGASSPEAASVAAPLPFVPPPSPSTASTERPRS